MEQQINVGELPIIGVHPYLNAQKTAQNFCTAKEVYHSKIEEKEKIHEEMEEKGAPSPVKKIFSFMCVGVGLGLGYLEVRNVGTTLVGTGVLGEGGALLGGCVFAGIGLTAGHMLSSELKKDPFTGRKKPTAKWWGALGLTVIYVGSQCFLAYRAASGAGDGMEDTVGTSSFLICGIAIIEVVFGALFLKPAMQSLTLWYTTIRIWLIKRKMNKTSRQTEHSWQRHLFEVHTSNTTNETNYPHGKETDAIKDARSYFNSGGIF